MDIADKLKGEYVTVLIKEEKQRDLVAYEGYVININPHLYIIVEVNKLQEVILFAGYSKAIYQIKDEKGKVIYLNSVVLEEYNNRLVKSPERRKIIRNVGEFYKE